MALKAPTLPKEFQDKGYTVADETLKVKVSGGRANHDIEIGDSKEPGQYIPQSKHLFFDNEGNVSFRPKLFNPSVGSVVVEDGVVKYITDEWEHHMYENEGEVFGFEHDFVLKQKPTDLTQDYQVVYTIRTKGLKFYKQLPLTQAEIDDGCERPENVINSYAVYIDGKRGNHMYEGGKAYATGKVGHLYRVKAIDANGDWIWCDQNIDEQTQEYIQTVPKEFLETAVYPVRVDPELGYTTIGASYVSDQGANGVIRSTKITTTATSYVSSITVRSFDGSYSFKGVLFDASGKNLVSNGVGNATLTSSSLSWNNTSYFATIPTLATSTDYYAGVVLENRYIPTYYDSGSSGDDWYDTSNSYASPTDPTDGGTDSRLYSIFATYSTSANTYVFYTSEGADQLEAKNGINASSATASLNDLVTQATADTVTTDPSNFYAFVAPGTNTDTYHQIRRAILTFDTSILSGKTVTGGNLVVNVISKVASSGDPTDGDLHVVSASPADVTNIVAGDYDAFGSTSGGELTIADSPSSGSATIALNATGYGLINTTGDTSLGLRVEGDMENSMTWVTYALIGFRLRGANPGTTTVSYWPYLEVTYSAGGGGSPIASTGGVTWANLAKIAAIAKASIAKVAGVASS